MLILSQWEKKAFMFLEENDYYKTLKANKHAEQNISVQPEIHIAFMSLFKQPQKYSDLKEQIIFGIFYLMLNTFQNPIKLGLFPCDPSPHEGTLRFLSSDIFHGFFFGPFN